MSISIMWRKVSPTEGKSLPGVSSDWATYERIFGRRNLTQADAGKLLDLSLVASNRPFWHQLYEVVDNLSDGDEIAVWAEW